MPKYPPRNEPIRKNQILEKVVMELAKSIRNKDVFGKLKAKAEKVRSAQLNLIKAKLVLLIPYISEDVSEMKMLKTLKLNNEYREWERKSVEEIIDGYR